MVDGRWARRPDRERQPQLPGAVDSTLVPTTHADGKLGQIRLGADVAQLALDIGLRARPAGTGS
jgi:hypothetical protein